MVPSEWYDMLCVVASATNVANRGSVDASAALSQHMCGAKVNTRCTHAPANMESMLKSSLAEARPPLLLMALDSASANCRQREPTETPISTQWRKKPKLQCSPNLHGHLPPTLLVLQRKKRKITEVAAQT